MFKLSLYAAMAVLLVACSCAAAMPLVTAASLTANGRNGGHNCPDLSDSTGPGNVCEMSFSSLPGEKGNLAEIVSIAMNWSLESNGDHHIDWSSELQSSLVTIDFGRTVNLNSASVWGGDTPGSDAANMPHRAPVSGTRYRIPTDPAWSLRAHSYSNFDLIGNSVDVKFSQVPRAEDLAGRVPAKGSVGPTAPGPLTGLLVPGVLIAVGLMGRTNARSKRTRADAGRSLDR